MERLKRMRGSNTLKSSTKEYFQIPTVEEDEEIHRILNCKNYFEVLEVSPEQDLDKEEDFLTDSYLQKCLLLSPNQCAHPKLEAAYEKLQTAYDTLSVPKARAQHRRMHFGLNEEDRREEEQSSLSGNLFGGALMGRTLMSLPLLGGQQIIIHHGGNEADTFSELSGFLNLLAGTSVQRRPSQEAPTTPDTPLSRRRTSREARLREEEDRVRVTAQTPNRRAHRVVVGSANDSAFSRNPILNSLLRNLIDPTPNATPGDSSVDVSSPQETTNPRHRMLEQRRSEARERRANRNRRIASSSAPANVNQTAVTNREASETRPVAPPSARTSGADNNFDMFANIFQRLASLPDPGVSYSDEDELDRNRRGLDSGRRSARVRAQSNRRRSRPRAEATSQRESYARQLRSLADMGFTDIALNIQVLNLVEGRLEEAIPVLLSRH